MHLCSIDWGVHLTWLYMHCLYIERSAMRCAKFGVAVFKASILDWLGRTYAQLHWVYVYCLYIYRSVMRCAKSGVVVFKASMVEWLGGSICHGYMDCLYIYRSAMRCDKFGVVVFNASLLNWLGGPSDMVIYALSIYREICHEMCQVWCSSIQGIYPRLIGEDLCSIALGICVLSIYIYRSVMRCAKSGVVVFKASMVDWLGGFICHGYMDCLYIYRSAMRCAKLGVVVFNASLLNWLGGPSDMVIYALSIYREICHEMCQVWCSSIQGIYPRLIGEDLCSIALGICVLSIYIYIDLWWDVPSLV